MARKRKKTGPRRDDVLELRLRTSLQDVGLSREVQKLLSQEFARELRRKVSATDRAELEKVIADRVATYQSGSLAIPVRLKDGRVVLLTSAERDVAINRQETATPSELSATAAASDTARTATGAPASLRLPPATRAEFVLSTILNPDDRETILGDLAESYLKYALPRYGEHGARRWYRLQIWRSLVPLLTKRARAVLRWAVLADLVRRGISRLS